MGGEVATRYRVEGGAKEQGRGPERFARNRTVDGQSDASGFEI